MSFISIDDHLEYVLFFEDETGVERERIILAVSDNHAAEVAATSVVGGEGLLSSFVLTHPTGIEIPFSPY